MQILIFVLLFAFCAAKRHKESSTLSQYQSDNFRRIKPAPRKTPSRHFAKRTGLPYTVLGPVQDYDKDFMEEWRSLTEQLWTAEGEDNGISEALPTNANDFLPRKTEVPLRQSQLIAYWKPVSCRRLGFKLKPISNLQDNNKNLVILMRDDKTGKKYVFKTFSSPEAYTNELTFSQFVRPGTPYIVPAVCFLNRKGNDENDDEKPALIYEFVEGKQSLEYARHATLDDLKRISAELLVALEQIHTLDHLHDDLKPQNIIIGADGHVQVIDFGFSTFIEHGKRNQGTHTTMAPEIYSKVPGAVHEGIDWWAYGATVAMWFGAYYDEQDYRRKHKGRPSDRKGTKNTFVPMRWNRELEKFVRGQVPEAFPRVLRSFLFHFFHVDPDTRIYNTRRLIDVLRNHEFFEGINWTEIENCQHKYKLK